MRDYKVWTVEQETKLKEIYPHEKCDTLESIFGRKMSAITRRAKLLGVKRRTRRVNNINSDFSVLLNECCVTYYWIGFLMADGHFSNKNEFSMNLSIKDLFHLERFATFINTSVRTSRRKGRDYCHVRSMDQYFIPKIKEKFDLNSNKTEIPPNISVFKRMTDEQFLSWLVGFIDGDGNIKHQTDRDDYCIQIVNYKTWNGVHQYCIDRLSEVSGVQLFNKLFYFSIGDKSENLVKVTYTNLKLIQFLKRKAVEFNLPYLHRKWNLIDENRKHKHDIYLERVAQVKDLVRKGMSRKDIAQLMGLEVTGVDGIIYHEKIGVTHKRRSVISQFDKGGKLIARFSSIGEASEKTGINASSIGRGLTGITKFVRGFAWTREYIWKD